MFVGDNRIRLGVGVDVAGPQLRTDAAVGVDEMLREGRVAIAIALQLEPTENGRGHRLVVAHRTVCPAAFAGNDVKKSVAVDVDDAKRVNLAESSIIGVVRSGAAEDHALGESAVGVLLEPRETVAVRLDAGDDIVATIAIDIERVHLRAAFAEVRAMKLPV